MNTRRHSSSHTSRWTARVLNTAWQTICHPISGFLGIVLTLALDTLR